MLSKLHICFIRLIFLFLISCMTLALSLTELRAQSGNVFHIRDMSNAITESHIIEINLEHLAERSGVFARKQELERITLSSIEKAHQANADRIEIPMDDFPIDSTEFSVTIPSGETQDFSMLSFSLGGTVNSFGVALSGEDEGFLEVTVTDLFPAIVSGNVTIWTMFFSLKAVEDSPKRPLDVTLATATFDASNSLLGGSIKVFVRILPGSEDTPMSAETVEVTVGDSLQVVKEHHPPFSPASVVLSEHFTVPDPVNAEIDSIRVKSDGSALLAYIKLHLDNSATVGQTYSKTIDVIYLAGQQNFVVSHVFDVLAKPTIPTTVSQKSDLPDRFILEQNYPNPFNPNTTIAYSVPKSQNVILNVYNLQGQELATLVNAKKTAGNHKVTFDAHQLPSGVYLYRIYTDEHFETKQMILLK